MIQLLLFYILSLTHFFRSPYTVWLWHITPNLICLKQIPHTPHIGSVCDFLSGVWTPPCSHRMSSSGSVFARLGVLACMFSSLLGPPPLSTNNLFRTSILVSVDSGVIRLALLQQMIQENDQNFEGGFQLSWIGLRGQKDQNANFETCLNDQTYQNFEGGFQLNWIGLRDQKDRNVNFKTGLNG